jgi:Domain of unknown function (DUF4760)
MGTSKNGPHSSGATKLPRNDSALFPFRFIDVHPEAVSDRQREQFFEVPLYKTFKAKAPSMTSIPDPLDATKRDYDDIGAFLNICELIAVGVRKRAFSKSVSKAYWGDIIPDSYQTAKQLINYIRNTPGEGSRLTYVDLEKLAKRWDAKDR